MPGVRNSTNVDKLSSESWDTGGLASSFLLHSIILTLKLTYNTRTIFVSNIISWISDKLCNSTMGGLIIQPGTLILGHFVIFLQNLSFITTRVWTCTLKVPTWDTIRARRSHSSMAPARLLSVKQILDSYYQLYVPYPQRNQYYIHPVQSLYWERITLSLSVVKYVLWRWWNKSRGPSGHLIQNKVHCGHDRWFLLVM